MHSNASPAVQTINHSFTLLLQADNQSVPQITSVVDTGQCQYRRIAKRTFGFSFWLFIIRIFPKFFLSSFTIITARCISYDRFRLSVCLSVYLSVTVRYRAKTTPATIMRSSLEDSLMTLVYTMALSRWYWYMHSFIRHHLTDRYRVHCTAKFGRKEWKRRQREPCCCREKSAMPL